MDEVIMQQAIAGLSQLGAAAIGWRCGCGKAHLIENRPGLHECDCGRKVEIPIPKEG